MRKEINKLRELNACLEALEWLEYQTSPQQAWDSCERSDWMLWLLGRLSKGPRSRSRKQLVLIACECARLSLKYVQKGEDRPLIAIETAEAWTRGEATLDEVRNASAAPHADSAAAYTTAYYAAHAAYAAASVASDAASAAAYAAAAHAVYAAAVSAAYYAADAADAANKETFKQCADIVRKHHPKSPKL